MVRRARKLGESCWLATASGSDICARLARIASCVEALQGGGVFRFNDLFKTIQQRRRAVVLKYASTSHPRTLSRGDYDRRMRAQGWPFRRGPAFLVGCSDAASGDQSPDGKYRLGCVVGLMSSALNGPRHGFQWTPKFPRKMGESSLGGGEVYAFSEMIDSKALLREFYAPFSRMSPGLVGMEDCESLFTHLKNKKMVTEKYLVRHFLSIQPFY